MTLDKIKTGSGKRLRTDALVENALLFQYEAAAMPGASVLGTDGQVYSSIKIGGVYQWSKAPAALSTGEIFLGVSEPRTNFNYNLSVGGINFTPAIQAEGGDPDNATISTVRYTTETGPAYFVLGRVNSASPLANTAVTNAQDAGTILFMGADGTELIPGAAITANVTGTVESGSVPMQLNLRTRPEGAVTGTPIIGRLRITPDGNVLIGNTAGTEKLDVTGNIKASGSLIGDTLSISGQSVRTTALQETALPIALDATTMPGASVLGSDGQIYSSIKIGATYQWSKTPAALSTGEIFLGVSEPRTNFNYTNAGGTPTPFTPAIQIEGGNNSDSSLSITRYGDVNTDVSRLLLCRARGSQVLSNTSVQSGDTIATILFMGSDGSDLVPGAGITTGVQGAVASVSVPMRMAFRTLPEGSSALANRFQIQANGNVLVNNTTGTERLSVTGNIQLTETSDSYKVGSDNVVGARKTGWAAPTGTATRTTFATYAGQDVTDPPTETEVQNIDDHVKILSERLKALIDDLTSHGLIGPTP